MKKRYKNLKLESHPAVRKVFDKYPRPIKEKMLKLRDLILKVASDEEEIDSIVETLKWGEPSYLTKKSSTIRIDWKEKKPDQYAMYFQCTSRLVPTFKAIFKDMLTYEGTRAILFRLDEPLPTEILEQCILAALKYHRVKHLPLLGL